MKLYLTFSLIGIVFLAGCTSYTLEDVKKANPNETSAKTALEMCKDVAEKCFVAPFERDMSEKECWNIYYYTGDSAEILDYAKDMC